MVFTLANISYATEYAVFVLMDTAYTMNYVDFSGDGYYLYNALRSIFEGQILFILCTMQYFRGPILKGTGTY